MRIDFDYTKNDRSVQNNVWYFWVIKFSLHISLYVVQFTVNFWIPYCTGNMFRQTTALQPWRTYYSDALWTVVRRKNGDDNAMTSVTECQRRDTSAAAAAAASSSRCTGVSARWGAVERCVVPVEQQTSACSRRQLLNLLVMMSQTEEQ